MSWQEKNAREAIEAIRVEFGPKEARSYERELESCLEMAAEDSAAGNFFGSSYWAEEGVETVERKALAALGIYA